jgi:hypothetical protein
MGQAADATHRKIAAFNAQDAKEYRELLGPDIEWAIPGGLLQGPDQVDAFNSALWEEFPDIELTATRIVEQGSAVVIQAQPKECMRERFTLLVEISLPRANACACRTQITSWSRKV